MMAFLSKKKIYCTKMFKSNCDVPVYYKMRRKLCICNSLLLASCKGNGPSLSNILLLNFDINFIRGCHLAKLINSNNNYHVFFI